MIRENIRAAIEKALGKLGVGSVDFIVEHPAELSHGDYAANVALVAGKEEGKNPQELAEAIVQVLRQAQDNLNLRKIEVAGPGFINFYLTRDFFANSIKKIDEDFGKNKSLKGQKILIEYTDPNPFKQFHIGHLMTNTVGEALARILEYSGARVRRVNYQGDVGMHVAKAVWGKLQKPEAAWGDAYAYGAQKFEEHKEEITELNKKIYDRSDSEINTLYDEGRQESLEYFEEIYKILDTSFDHYFFESQVGVLGKKLVEERVGDVFTESDGAVVFSQEKSGLHTRVFLNSQGLPTYEAKELGLAKLKYDWWKYDSSLIVTGNEIDEYFKVLQRAMAFVYPDLAKKTHHISHGMLRLPSGKMSSRTGDVITGMSLIEELKAYALERMKDKDEQIAEHVAIAAIKYTILKQTMGKNIIFDQEKSLSLEGDSGPYVQYTYVRTQSVLAKARQEKVKASTKGKIPEVVEVEKLLYRFPEMVEQATKEYAPHTVVHFLTELASSFNTFYAQEKIVDTNDPHAPYKVALTKAVGQALKNGMWLLGIPVPERM